MRKVYDEVRAGLYTLDHDMELSPAVVAPNSDLARIPYFVLAQTLAQVRSRIQHPGSSRVCRHRYAVPCTALH